MHGAGVFAYLFMMACYIYSRQLAVNVSEWQNSWDENTGIDITSVIFEC